MKTFVCLALFVAAASASIINPLGSSIGLGGISALGLGLGQQQVLLSSPPLVSKVGLGSQLLSSSQLLSAPQLISSSQLISSPQLLSSGSLLSSPQLLSSGSLISSPQIISSGLGLGLGGANIIGASQLNSGLGLGLSGLSPLGLGSNKIISNGLGLSGINSLNGQIISPINSGLLLKK